MAATAVCEQYAIELSEMGDKAKHIVPHSLHPTAAATNFMTRRTADGNKTTGDEFKNFIKEWPFLRITYAQASKKASRSMRG